ncbi:hypothetical protein [Marinicella sp. W31]|uniref:hypothetical protein n=1 Tax=Marinicella sp. W31 TaxID=3023713 RepID=UPI003756AB1A
MKTKKLMSSMMAFFMLSLLAPVQAADFCVTNSQELQNALDAARNNGQNDLIRMATGTYTGGFGYSGAEDFDLTITGGYTLFFKNPCGQRTATPFETIVDGDELEQGMILQAFANSDIKVSYLTFINGVGTRGAGLEFRTFENYVGDVLVENSAFINNEADFAAALNIGRGTKHIVRNNVFVANNSIIGTGTVDMISNDSLGVYFINNTLINNTTDSSDSDAHSGLRLFLSGTSKAFVANNIMQGNEGADIRISNGGDTSYLYNNNVGTILGSFDVQANNINSQPIFGGGFFNYVPELESGEINKGRNSPFIVPIPTPFNLAWSTGTTDFSGNLRVQDGRVDIGALEALPEIPIFKNGFEIIL